MGSMQILRELGRTRAAAPLKQAVKRAIDLVDGTTFRARSVPTPDGPISSFYERHGYAIFRGAIELTDIAALQAALDAEVIESHGAFLRHKSTKHEPNIFLEGTNIPMDGLLDPHAQSESPRTAAAIESLLLTDRIADLLTSIDAPRTTRSIKPSYSSCRLVRGSTSTGGASTPTRADSATRYGFRSSRSHCATVRWPLCHGRAAKLSRPPS
jgi:hypothetical protein